jgi:hypothetical protein
VADALTAAKALARSQSVTADAGSDMGYSFGELLDGTAADASPAAVYVRLWQRTPRGWRVVVDMLTRTQER